MVFYKTSFPTATVLPKMHLMEAHMIPWIKEYKVAFGLMGEQGAESIHASINGIKRAYANISEQISRLKCILKEHHRHVCPILAREKPSIKRRKKNNSNS